MHIIRERKQKHKYAFQIMEELGGRPLWFSHFLHLRTLLLLSRELSQQLAVMEGRRSGAAWGWARFLLAVVACVAVVVGGDGAAAAATEAGAPSASVDCSSAITGLIDCLGYVQNGSKVEKPEGSCCPGLKKVLKTQASCLCDAFKSSAQFGVALNMTKALGLPAACGVSAPSVSNCKIPGLGASPAPAPHSSSHPSPAPAPAPAPSTAAGEGIRGAPAPAPAKAAAPTFSVPSVALLVTGLAISACISL